MNVVIVSSEGQCGIRECSQVLVQGFLETGHSARFLGVERHSNVDLRRKMRHLDPEDEVVIFEYEPGIFWPYGLIREMFVARFLRGKKLVLSIHEFSPDKFAEYRVSQNLWWAAARSVGLQEIARAFGLAALLALRFARLRIAFLLLARMPHVIVAHSPRTVSSLEVAVPPSLSEKVAVAPLAVKSALGDREKSRRALGLPLDPFVFIIPGFIFRRKRIIEVIEQLPPESELWVVGIAPDWEKDYVREVEAYLEGHSKADQVRVIQDYGIEPYIQAADVVVLYYSEIFQSAVASQAAGAGKPCIFSDLPGFAPFQSIGIVVDSSLELRRAMLRIQEPSCYRQLVNATECLRDRLSPGKIAVRYLNVLERSGEVRGGREARERA